MTYAALIAMMAGAASGGGPDPNPKSLVFACGFECGRLGSVGEHWTTNAQASISTSTVRNGDRSLRYNVSATESAIVAILAAQTVYVGRLYIRFATLPSADCYIAWCSSGTDRVGIAFKQSDSKIYCATAATPSMGASGVAVTTGVWYRIDFKIDQTPGAKAADARVDGVALGQKTSASGGAAATFAVGARGNNVTGDWFYDDVAISATSGDYPIGAGHVHHFVPVADGSHNVSASNSFTKGDSGSGVFITNPTTDSYQLIDDVPLDDATPDAGDHIGVIVGAGSSNYVEHRLGPASGISTPALGPRGIEVIYGHHAQGSGSASPHSVKINDNGTEDTVQAFSATGAVTTRYGRKHYTNPPSAAAVWTTATGDGNFNNLRTRFGYVNAPSNPAYLSCVMIEAEFSD